MPLLISAAPAFRVGLVDILVKSGNSIPTPAGGDIRFATHCRRLMHRGPEAIRIDRGGAERRAGTLPVVLAGTYQRLVAVNARYPYRFPMILVCGEALYDLFLADSDPQGV